MSKLVLEVDDTGGIIRALITVDGRPVGLVQRLEVKQNGMVVDASVDIVELDVGKQGSHLLRSCGLLRVSVIPAHGDDDPPPWSETDRVT